MTNSSEEKETTQGEIEEAPGLLQEAFDVFAKASQQLEKSYEELKIKADRLALELAQANEELQIQLSEKEKLGNFLSNILQSIQSGIVVISPEGDVVLTNHLAGEMLSLGDQLQGQSYEQLFQDNSVGQFIKKCFAELEKIPVVEEVELEQTSEEKTVLKLGFSSVTDRNDQVVSYLLVVQDITRLKLLEEQALRTSRLTAMGEIAAQLAHEIRNPLGSIEIFASLLSRDLKGDPNQKLADNIVVGVKSLNSVVTNMLTFTRTVAIHPEKLEFNQLIRETFGFLEQVLKVQDIRLELVTAGDIDQVEVDPELIKQVLLNLAQNSISAMEKAESPLLRVRTSAVEMEGKKPAVEVVISDNGCGIQEEDLPKIFDPFFSTRKRGTGIGLSVVSQIIEKHGGLITAESKVGEGTSIRFRLPVSR